MSNQHQHKHGIRHTEGDSKAWERRLDEDVLFHAGRRDIANFIDDTKMRLLRPVLPPVGSVLEVGAGSGRLLARVGMEGTYRLVAVDYATYSARAVRENLRRTQLEGQIVFGDAQELPFHDSSFDVVLSGGLLEHFREPGAVLGEMRRVLRPGGLFYADIVPSKFSSYRLSEWPRMRRNDQMSEGIYESDLSKSAWEAALIAAGLRSVRVVAAGVYPPYVIPRFDQLTWKIARSIRALDGTRLADIFGFFYLCTARK